MQALYSSLSFESIMRANKQMKERIAALEQEVEFFKKDYPKLYDIIGEKNAEIERLWSENRKARAEEWERCAKVCESHARACEEACDMQQAEGAFDCGAAIRALGDE